MYVISSSYGNDSCALIYWAHGFGLHLIDDVYVTFIDTGWAGDGWMERVAEKEEWVRSLGFIPVRITPPVQFEDLMVMKKGFPNQRYQWCSVQLKGIPFLQWIDEADPDCKAVVLIGKRRDESAERASTPEYVDESEYHGGRRLWHPLYLHSEADRDLLLDLAGIEPLPHRSQECAPCVNANRADFLILTEKEIARVEALEKEVGNLMFRRKRYISKMYPEGCTGIRQVIQWAHKAPLEPEEPQGFATCSSGYCGH